MTTYYDLAAQYGTDNIRHMGNKALAIDRRHGYAIGYTIDSYNGYTPDALSNKVYTAFSNLPTDPSWNDIYDYLFGTPSAAPDFSKVV